MANLNEAVGAQLEAAPTITHDGTLESCSRVKRWARTNGFEFVSTFSESSELRAHVITIGRGDEVLRLRCGDQAYVLNGRLSKDWWRAAR